MTDERKQEWRSMQRAARNIIGTLDNLDNLVKEDRKEAGLVIMLICERLHAFGFSLVREYETKLDTENERAALSY